MSHSIPPSLLFDFSIQIPSCMTPPVDCSTNLIDWSTVPVLFQPGLMTTTAEFAQLQLAWNTDGIAIRVVVTGKTKLPAASVNDGQWQGDFVKLWLDTRPSGQIHRASEYCHAFAAAPVATDGQPLIESLPIPQQKFQRQKPSVGEFRLLVQSDNNGYDLQIWMPENQLNGYRDISEIGKLGLNAEFYDSELGQQFLMLDDNLPDYNPSLWMQLELLQ